jgi:hypothetical protein
MNNYQNNYQKLLNNLGESRAPEGLYRAVISRVSAEQNRSAKKRFVVAVGSLVASVAASVAAVLVLATSLTQSGFWKFVSLAFSDGGTVMTYWRQFSMSLLESFSMPEMVVSLVCVFAVMLSLKFLLKNKNAFSNNLQLNYV